MINVLIVGSKGKFEPDKDLEFQKIYAANSAVGLQWDGLSKLTRVTSVVNSCGHGRFDFNALPIKQKRYFRTIANARPDHCVIIGDEPHACPKLYAPNTLPNNVIQISARSFRQDILRPLKLRSFVLSGEILSRIRRLPLHSLLNLMRKIIFARIKTTFHRNRWDLAHFRPSTGILTLIFAINRHGTKAKYFLSNIGVSNRDNYGPSTETTNAPILPTHVLADIQTLNELTESYQIYSNDPELLAHVPRALPYCSIPSTQSADQPAFEHKK